MQERRLRVLLVDDHPIVLAGMKALINSDSELDVVGEAKDGRSAIGLACELLPDIAILDISLPSMSGIDLAKQLRLKCPTCKLIALTVHEDRGYLRRLLELGVAGYVVKRSATDELTRAIHIVSGGGVYLDPAIAGKVVSPHFQDALPPVSRENAELSDREVEVLKLTAAGHSNKAVAAALDVGIKSVETYKSRAMEKLGFQSRVELVRYAAAKGWL
jgi:DNA-binding NarL/FixJ family response regulator